VEPPRIRLMCVDDHRIVREGISLIVGQEPDMTVVASAASGEEAVELFRLQRPDVTLMDLQLKGMNGVEAIRCIRGESPEARIIVLTMFEGDEDIYRALEAGAVSYLLKDALSEDLIRFVRDVHAGKRPLNPDIEARLTERGAGPTLTPREIQVVGLVAQGMRNREIAAALGISEDTAHVHVKNILLKLHVKDRTAAVNVALKRGIIHLR
jgi:DNA-binding NarL/FixJ family response regulator